MSFTKHFLIRSSKNDEHNIDQMVMSSGNYFGRNESEYLTYLPVYAHLQHHLVTNKNTRK
jgi:hypothetical protein